MYDINFLAYAYDKNKNDLTYNSFLIPFTFFALLNNDNSHVEIIVKNPEYFKKIFKKELELLQKFNNNFIIRKYQYKINHHIPNTYRFFERPVVESKYTYISDIDIMYLDKNITSLYEKKWPQNLPYNNMLRYKNNVRLTGVFMVKNNEYYTDNFFNIQNKYYKNHKRDNDEIILGKMCREVHGLPNFNHRFRPIYGIHFSPNRGTNKEMNLRTTKNYYDIYMEIKSNHEEFFKFKIFQKLTKQLTNNFIIKN
jgi:hypothetical protein